MLLCPVRHCRLPLTRDQRRWHCARSHSFDVARSGYVNLLQPQERRSKNPGDSAEVVEARQRLHARGLTDPLLRGIMKLARASAGEAVLDAGCGDGFYLGSLVRQTGCAGAGIDISIPAVDAAARVYPECQWVVANADRFVPFADGSFSLVMSITARTNAGEFRRVLKEGGRVLVGVPAMDDLVELRGPGPDRASRIITEFAQGFTLTGRTQVTTSADLDGMALHDTRLSIYRPVNENKADSGMRVTFSLDFLLFTRTLQT